METIHRSFARSGLIRNTDDKVLGGVCSGLGSRFGVDAWAIRLLLIISLVVIPGSQILLYPLAWILMPDERRAAAVLNPQPAPAPVMVKTPA